MFQNLSYESAKPA